MKSYLRVIISLFVMLQTVFSDDSYEPNDSINAATGAHLTMENLVAADSDFYKIPLGAGDGMVSRSIFPSDPSYGPYQLWHNPSKIAQWDSDSIQNQEIAAFYAPSDGWYYVYFPANSSTLYSLHLDIEGGNNDFSDRRTMTLPSDGSSKMTFGWNTHCDTESGEPFPTTRTLYNSVWWQYQPTSSGTLELDTQFANDGNGGGLDTVVAVYKGTSLANLELVTYNDDVDSSHFWSGLTAQVEGGETYQIAVYGYGSDDEGYVGLSGKFTATPSSLSLGDSSQSFTSSGGTHSFSVSGNVSWSASEGVSWVNITSGSSGSGSGTVGYSVSANSSTSSRSATIMVTGGGITRSHTISQVGVTVSGDSYEPDDSASSAKTIYSGQTQNRSIHSAGNVDWVKFTVSETKDVILETDGSSGDTKMYLYGPNSSTTLIETDDDDGNGAFSRISRSLGSSTYYVKIEDYGNNGTIDAYTFSCDMMSVASLTIGDSSQSFTSSGGPHSFSVSGNVSWSAIDNSSWVNITSGSSGSGGGTISYSVSANSSTSSRSATITVSGGGVTRTHSISQAGATSSGDSYEPDDSASLAKTIYIDQTQNRSIHTAGDVDWVKFTVQSEQGIILEANELSSIAYLRLYGPDNSSSLVDSDTDGYGYPRIARTLSPGMYYLKIDGDNTATSAYALTMQTATISLSITDSAQSFSNEGGTHFFSIQGNVTWQVSNDASWVGITTAVVGSGDANIIYNVYPNTSAASRTATITVTGGGLTRTHTITQAGVSPDLSISDSSQSFVGSGGTHSFSVSGNVSWNASESASWVNITSGVSGSGSGAVGYSVSANSSTSSRSATMTVTGGGITRTHTISQSGAAPSLSIGDSSQSFASGGGTHSFSVSGNVSWSASDNASWVAVTSGSSGSGSGTVGYSVSANSSTASRSATITVTGGGITRTHTISQSGAALSLSIGDSSQSFASSGGTHSFSVSGNVSWSASDNTSWVAVTSGSSGSGSGTVGYSVSANSSTASRSATITVTGGGITRTHTISQSGVAVSKVISLSGDLTFGNTMVGSSATRTLTISNTGNSTLNVSSISYPSGFSGNWSGTIAAGASRNVTMTFAPTTATSYSGTVTVNSDKTSGTNTRSCSGTGTAVPTRIISLSGDLAFGDVTVGSSTTRTLTISNTGSSTLSVSGISYPSGFSGTWSGSVAAGGSQNVTVTFAPTTATSYSGTVTVNSDKTSGTNTRSCSGTGTAVPTRIISLSGDLGFGDVTVGSSTTRTLTISNTGSSTLSVSGISYPSGFSGTWSGSVAAGGSQNVTVTFAPTTATSYSGTVTVNSDKTSGTSTRSCSGNGNGSVSTSQSIVFSSNRSGNFDIWTMDDTGTNLTQLAQNALDEVEPKWSPDGTRIAYMKKRSTTDMDLRIMNKDGSGDTLVSAFTVPVGASLCDWAPEGDALLIVKRIGSLDFRLYLVDIPTGTHTELLNPAIVSDKQLYSGSFSPDGSNLVWCSQNGNWSPTLEVFSVPYSNRGIDASGVVQLTSDNQYDSGAVYSQDGTKIAYFHSEASNGYGQPFNIYTMNSDGSNPMPLTSVAAPKSTTWPAWSPSGDRILYHLDGHVWMMNANGTEQHVITTGSSLNYSAEWSPIERNISPTWTYRTDLPVNIPSAGTAIIDGKVYFAGGSVSPNASPWAHNSLWIYDLASNSWTSGPALSQRRRASGAGVLVNDAGEKEFYVVGGYSGYSGLSSVERYLPTQNTWETVAARGFAGELPSVAVVDNKLYAMGGHNNNSTCTSLNQVYDRDSNTWITLSPIQYNGENYEIRGAATAVHGSKIYLFGGLRGIGYRQWEYLSTTLIYDTLSDSWSSGQNAPHNINTANKAVTFGDMIYIFTLGGETNSVIDVYDTVHDLWSEYTGFPEADFRFTNVDQTDDMVFVTGDDKDLTTWLQCWSGEFPVNGLLRPDADGDGLPDSWEQRYFGSTTAALAGLDSDGDGLTNLDEFITGTDPANSASVFMVSSPVYDGSGFVINWDSKPAREYSIYWSTNLTSGFLPLVGASGVETPQNSYTDTTHNAESAGYYKVEVRLK